MFYLLHINLCIFHRISEAYHRRTVTYIKDRFKLPFISRIGLRKLTLLKICQYQNIFIKSLFLASVSQPLLYFSSQIPKFPKCLKKNTVYVRPCEIVHSPPIHHCWLNLSYVSFLLLFSPQTLDSRCKHLLHIICYTGRLICRVECWDNPSKSRPTL